MRPGQQNKRGRGRGNNNNNNGGGGNNNNNNFNRKGGNPLTRTYDSSGPDVKIRGQASHVYEKYLQLARDANSAGDRVTAENYLQHAEHYYRIMAATAAQLAQHQAQQAAQNANRPAGEQPQANGNVAAQPQGGQGGSTPSFSLAEPAGEDEGEEAEAE